MIAIHSRPGSFSDRWMEIARRRDIPFMTVDMFASDFISELRDNDVKGFLFHLPLFNRKTRLAAAAIAQSVEFMGIVVFPNHRTFWHFDDKIAQKYLFESLEIPFCPTWVFYDRVSALEWVSRATFPKVFKLRRGASSGNVQLIQSRKKAIRLINKMFGDGLRSSPSLLADYRTKVHKHSRNRDWLPTLKRLPQTVKNVLDWSGNTENERGYLYIQEYLRGNHFDIRVTIIGDRAFAFRRFVRPNDFRASGSGRIDYDASAIDRRCIEIAFEASRRIGSQCLAFDFAYGMEATPVVLEVSYGFVPEAIFNCPGYWDSQMRFHEARIWPQDAVLTDLVRLLDGGEAASAKEFALLDRDNH